MEKVASSLLKNWLWNTSSFCEGNASYWFFSTSRPSGSLFCSLDLTGRHPLAFANASSSCEVGILGCAATGAPENTYRSLSPALCDQPQHGAYDDNHYKCLHEILVQKRHPETALWTLGALIRGLFQVSGIGIARNLEVRLCQRKSSDRAEILGGPLPFPPMFDDVTQKQKGHSGVNDCSFPLQNLTNQIRQLYRVA